MRLVETEGWHEAGLLMLESAALLERAGAELLVCPDNTMHQALDLVRERSSLPWIHIAEEVAGVAASRGFKRLGLLGTRFLMEGPVYPLKLVSRQIAYQIPEVRDRERINRIIFDELVYGRFEAGSRDYLRGVIATLGERGCDAVVLGCTEIPLLISESDSPLPALDSTRILARAAIRAATGESEGRSPSDKSGSLPPRV